VRTRERLDDMKNAARRTAEEWPVARAVETVRRVCSEVREPRIQGATA
jgi:hypothetical protein